VNTNLIKMTDKFINVKDLDIDLIDSINPFQLADKSHRFLQVPWQARAGADRHG
jgi:hypothetical protein